MQVLVNNVSLHISIIRYYMRVLVDNRPFPVAEGSSLEASQRAAALAAYHVLVWENGGVVDGEDPPNESTVRNLSPQH